MSSSRPKARDPQPQASAAAIDGEALRCCCGSLLARLVDAAVELKCRRCKRVILVPLSPPGTGPPRRSTSR